MNFIWLKTTSVVLPASLSSSFSPMHGRTKRPASKACLTFSPMSWSLSPKTFLLSECPRMTHWAPLSKIMAGLISPVNAPFGHL